VRSFIHDDQSHYAAPPAEIGRGEANGDAQPRRRMKLCKDGTSICYPVESYTDQEICLRIDGQRRCFPPGEGPDEPQKGARR
jgi:hypothetical protein